MIKFLLDLFGKRVVFAWWESLHQKSAFPIRYIGWTSSLILLVFCFLFVDIPTKDESPAMYLLNKNNEIFRLHANTTKLFRLKDKADRYADDCRDLERQIADLFILTMRIKTMVGAKPEDIARSEQVLASLKKKLRVAQIAKYTSMQLYDKTYAVR